MDGDLKSLLKGLDCEEEVMQKLSDDGCVNISLFSTWVDKIEEVTGMLPEGLRQNPASKSKLKQAWKRAASANERAIKRLSEGLSEEAVDEPLPPDVQRDVMKNATDFYRWGKICSRRILGDRGFAKIRKEFQGWQPSHYALSKCRSLYDEKKDAPTKRQRLSDDVFISMVAMQEEIGTVNIITFGEFLRLLVVTWVVCGCYDVPLQADSQERTKMCAFEEADEYWFEFTSRINKLREKYTDASIVRYLVEMEEHCRSVARDQCRSSQKIPFGKALLNSLRSEAHKWQELRDLLQMKDRGGNGNKNGGGKGNGKDQPNAPKFLPPPPSPKAKGKGKGDGEASKYKFAQKDGQGKQFCHKYNQDANGCKREKCDFVHACNAMMSSGKPCGSTSHGRHNHHAGRDGVAQLL